MTVGTELTNDLRELLTSNQSGEGRRLFVQIRSQNDIWQLRKYAGEVDGREGGGMGRKGLWVTN